MYELGQIYDLISTECGCEVWELNPQVDIFAELGVAGDDFHDLIDAYARQFEVCMDNYLWYFHTDEEALSFTSSIFGRPYQKVNRIAVTPQMLLQFANSKCWQLDYPLD